MGWKARNQKRLLERSVGGRPMSERTRLLLELADAALGRRGELLDPDARPVLWRMFEVSTQ